MSDSAPSRVLAADGRTVVVAIDHPLYSWPCRGLEDRRALVRTAVEAGADAFITSYGTARDLSAEFGATRRIVKLDLTTVSVDSYPLTPYRLAWTVEDAVRVRADAVLTYVQLGGPEELEALTAAAAIAAAADAAGIAYVCEIMPVAGERFPDAADPVAITAATRCGVELGAHIIKTSMPSPPEAIAAATSFGVPVITAGGDPAAPDALLAAIKVAMGQGSAGVAVGRNVWGAPDPAAIVRGLVAAVHGPRGPGN